MILIFVQIELSYWISRAGTKYILIRERFKLERKKVLNPYLIENIYDFQSCSKSCQKLK